MKSRRAIPSLLFLLSLTTVPSVAREKAIDTKFLHAGSPDARHPPAFDGGKDSTSTGSKSSLGTKDAPVDGLDGKPHEGPFVETSPDERRKKAASDSLSSTYDSTEKSESSSSSGKSGDKSTNSRGSSSDDDDDGGVMSDKSGRSSATGHTGTEGGISEKDKDRKTQEGLGASKGKIPDSPKEPVELPDSIEDRIGLKEKTEKSSTSSKSNLDDDKSRTVAGLEKPHDLPERPHDIPPPVPVSPTLPKGVSGSSSESHKESENAFGRPNLSNSPASEEDEDGIIQPFHSYILSLTMILFSEVGDKTFLVAALMAMRHARLVVFSAAFSALFVMTVLSAVLGHALPTLLPKRFTSFAAAVLFLVFGAKMLREGLAMKKDEGVGEEMKEVEMELEEKEHQSRIQGRRRSSNISPYALEAGRGRKSRSDVRLPAPPRSPSSSRSPSPSLNRSSLQRLAGGVHNLFSLLLSPAWVQTFVMTFLGEWGDRSQIATIAMAAGQDYWWVTGGAITGHGICTAAAVVGGAAIAGRVSLRVVTLGGAFAFLAFGIIYLLETAYSDWSS